MNNSENTFEKGALTVTYEPKKCIHANMCCEGLQEVFKDSVIPWIDLDGADTDRIIKQVRKCPSGALSFTKAEELVAVK